jgi:hypothetical protein
MGVNPSRGTGHSIRPLLQRDIELAQAETKSAHAAARYLNVAFSTYKKYAKRYGLYEQHLNMAGKGVKRSKIQGPAGLQSIFDGQHPGYDRTLLKNRLIAAGFLPQECALCGFHETRILDGKCPLLLNYKDDNNLNLALENLELRCYNCQFLTSGKINANYLNRREAPAIPSVQDAQLRLDMAALTPEEIEQLQKEALNLSELPD